MFTSSWASRPAVFRLPAVFLPYLLSDNSSSVRQREILSTNRTGRSCVIVCCTSAEPVLSGSFWLVVYWLFTGVFVALNWFLVPSVHHSPDPTCVVVNNLLLCIKINRRCCTLHLQLRLYCLRVRSRVLLDCHSWHGDVLRLWRIKHVGRFVPTYQPDFKCSASPSLLQRVDFRVC